jgi:mannose-6-phosphate isomerase-like protein (cupin superfamily)
VRTGAVVEKAWGREIIIANRAFCGKVMQLRRGFRCSMHYHREKDETFLVTAGKVRVEIGQPGTAEHDARTRRLQVVVLSPGHSIDVPPLTLHRFTGLEDSEFVEFSTHDEPEDSYRVEPSGPVPRADL